MSPGRAGRHDAALVAPISQWIWALPASLPRTTQRTRRRVIILNRALSAGRASTEDAATIGHSGGAPHSAETGDPAAGHRGVRRNRVTSWARVLVERSGIGFSPSTVRNELAELETLGLLTHPHTSAGRMPTESGYRIYAEGARRHARGTARPELGVDLRSMRNEIEQALRMTTEMLSDATRLLALVSAPSLQTASIRRIEVLTLQPSSVMVVVITSTGGVTKRVFKLDGAGRPGTGRMGRGVPGGAVARRRAHRVANRPAPPGGARARTSRAGVSHTHRSDANGGWCGVWPGGVRRWRGGPPWAGRGWRESKRRCGSSSFSSAAQRCSRARQRSTRATPPGRARRAQEVGGAGAPLRLARRRDVRDPLHATRCGWSRGASAGWTTRRRFGRCAPRRSSFSRFVEDVYEDA